MENRIFKKILMASALATALILQPRPLSVTQFELARKLCNRAIASVRENVESRINADIAAIKISRIHPYYENPHNNRRFQITIVLDADSKAYSFIVSKQLQRRYANEIFAACHNIAQLSFGISRSPRGETIFLMPDGAVRHAACYIPSPYAPAPLPWGYIVCA